MTNRREREASERGNGKAMHAGPIRHPHKINQLARVRPLARSFVLINETQRGHRHGTSIFSTPLQMRPFARAVAPGLCCQSFLSHEPCAFTAIREINRGRLPGRASRARIIIRDFDMCRSCVYGVSTLLFFRFSFTFNGSLTRREKFR